MKDCGDIYVTLGPLEVKDLLYKAFIFLLIPVPLPFVLKRIMAACILISTHLKYIYLIFLSLLKTFTIELNLHLNHQTYLVNEGYMNIYLQTPQKITNLTFTLERSISRTRTGCIC